MKNGTFRLKTRLFIFPKSFFGIKKWGIQKVYQRFWKDYVNYEEPDFACWEDYCWDNQIERLI